MLKFIVIYLFKNEYKYSIKFWKKDINYNVKIGIDINFYNLNLFKFIYV